VGSVLPDIIDKPIGHFLFREEIGNGRIYAHTLLFFLLTLVAGLVWYRMTRGSQSDALVGPEGKTLTPPEMTRRTWVLGLSLGTATHLAFDQMWRNTRTLFWPLDGWNFQRIDTGDWIPAMLRALKAEPGIYVPEVIGAFVLGWFAWWILHRRGVRSFLRRGLIPGTH
jgi:hypothetical protein